MGAPLDGEYTGRFWIAGDTNTAEGRLRYRTGMAPQLLIIGELTPFLEVVSESNGVRAMSLAKDGPEVEDVLIHGTLVGQPARVTLVGCFTRSRRSQMFGGVSEQVFEARYAVRGDHLASNELEFDEVYLRFATLDEWARLGGFNLSRRLDRHGATIEFDMPQQETVSLADGSTLSVDSQMCAPWTVDPHQMAIQREAWVHIRAGSSRSWRDIDRLYIRPLMSLLQLCTLQPASLLSVRVGRSDSDFELVPGWLAQPGGSVDWSKFPLLLSHVGMDVVAEWLDCVVDLHPAASVLSDLVTRRSVALESDLLLLTTIAEGFHRSTFSNVDRLDKATSYRLRGLIKAAIGAESPRVQNIVSGRMSHLEEMSYINRLLDLAREAELALRGVTGTTKRWAKMMYEARNTFAHGTNQQLDDKAVDDYAVALESIRWVLHMNLLLVAGVPPLVLAKQFANGQRYQHFLAQASTVMPRVYGGTPSSL